MQKILVPTDFSANAFKAIAYAAEIAKVSGAQLHLLHVIEPSVNMVTMQTDSLNKEVIKNRTTQLSNTLKSASSVYPEIKITPSLIGGKVADSIINYSQKNGITLIVMGTKGAGGMKKFLIGTVASETVSKSRVPVLTIPVSYQVAKPENIVFATNQFEKNNNILENIMHIPALFSSVIHVAVVRESGANEDAELIYNEEQLNDYVKFLEENYSEIKFKAAFIEGEDFETSIESYCDKNGVDMVTMVTYPKTFFERIFQRSETKRMVFHSTIPTLAIPAIPLMTN